MFYKVILSFDGRSVTTRHRPTFISINSGKGGVGKTTVAVNLAEELSAQGKKVTLVDADFSGANINAYYNTNNKPNIQNYLGLSWKSLKAEGTLNDTKYRMIKYDSQNYEIYKGNLDKPLISSTTVNGLLKNDQLSKKERQFLFELSKKIQAQMKEDILTSNLKETPSGTRILCGIYGNPKLSELPDFIIEQMLADLSKQAVDYIIVDTSPGLGTAQLTIANYVDIVVHVSDPYQTTFDNTFSFVRGFSLKYPNSNNLKSHVMVINRCDDEEQSDIVVERFNIAFSENHIPWSLNSKNTLYILEDPKYLPKKIGTKNDHPEERKSKDIYVKEAHLAFPVVTRYPDSETSFAFGLLTKLIRNKELEKLQLVQVNDIKHKSWFMAFEQRTSEDQNDLFWAKEYKGIPVTRNVIEVIEHASGKEGLVALWDKTHSD